ncbi:unnamed protein product [Leptidea sinapis]|uniref:Endonuclease/exonuclease/phosphatase domain-containing protein n=1 Tax=Leptidea sinapis TaxID=189913 RepID=A0A5E4PTW6_9NEOP|nr:unnamed protein product [Leptidea sinapis]
MYSIVEDSGLEVSYMLGDFNSHPGTRFADEMLSFCTEQQLLCADMEFLGSNTDTFTFMSDAQCPWLTTLARPLSNYLCCVGHCN